MLAIAADGVLGGAGVGRRARTPSVVDAATAATLLLFVVVAVVVAVAAGGAGGPNVVGVALEAALHLALDLGVGDARGRLEVGGVDGAGQGDGRGQGRRGSVIGHATSDTEQLEQVVELAVDVAAHGHGGPHGLDVGLFHEALLDDLAQTLHVGLGQVPAQLGLLQPLVGARALCEPRGPWLGDVAVFGHGGEEGRVGGGGVGVLACWRAGVLACWTSRATMGSWVTSQSTGLGRGRRRSRGKGRCWPAAEAGGRRVSLAGGS